MPIEYDESRLPTVIIRLPPRELTTSEFAAFLENLSRYNARANTYLILDVRSSPPLSAERRRQVADQIDCDAQLHGRTSPCALVLNSNVHVGISRVLMWLSRSSPLIKTFKTVEDAAAWLLAIDEQEIRMRNAKVS
jgi:hypothetical protein